RQAPDDPETWSACGDLWLDTNEYRYLPRAIECFSHAIDLADSNDDPSARQDNFSALAGAYLIQGDYAQARQAIAQALKIAPSELAEGELGEIQLETGHPAAALQDFSQAIAEDGSDPWNYKRRAAARLELADTTRAADTTDALDDLAHAAVLDPTVRPNHALLHLHLGRLVDARLALGDPATMSASNAPEAWLALGRIDLAASNSAAARRDFTNAASIKPRIPDEHSTHAIALAYLGQFNAALAEAASARAADPDDPQRTYDLAVIFALRSAADADNASATSDRASAIKLLTAAAHGPLHDWEYLADDFDLRSLRNDADFKRLVSTLKSN
ncbi:MAG TPA: hypothetical protein VMD30_04655, partial [Tepidisphaeraceae bacterium]|nr:hypothetical protein [Tepidisphaeraceae bacterium]